MSLAVLADHMASKGRGPDSMLIHMSPREVQGLQSLAMAHGGSLTINPETGLPEAGFLDKLLPTIIGAGLSFIPGVGPLMAAGIVGGIQTVRTGDIGKGLAAGLGAYGGAGLAQGLATAGTGALSAEVGGEALKAAGLTGEAALTAEADQIAQRAIGEKLATATPYETLSAGASQVVSSPQAAGTFLKNNAKNLMYAAGPAIMAGENVQAKGPQTVTKPGMIRPYSFDPYGGTYTAGTPYEAAPAKAADGGLMSMNDGGYAPGQLNFAERSEPVVRMAEGGDVVRMAGGTPPAMLSDEALYQQTGSWEAAAAARDAQNNAMNQYTWEQQAAPNAGSLVNDKQIFDYFAAPGTKTDAQIAADMQTFNVSAADIARATGTQNQQGGYESRFVNAILQPGITAGKFNEYTADVGLTGQNLANALANSGLSQSAQYALTHGLNDAGGVKGTGFYDLFGYKAGDAPGDVGGLKGLYDNINFATKGLQGEMVAGNLTGQQAREAALTEMNRIGVSAGDVKAATGKTLAELFPDTITKLDTKVVPTGTGGTSVIPGGNYGNATNPGDITTNSDGTVTVHPNIPGRPPGGFTGMGQVKDVYTQGGGSLGYLPYAPRTIEEFNRVYGSRLTGGSKQSLDYLTGKTPYDPTPYTKTGEIQKPYWESVGRYPVNTATKKYLFKDGKYVLNPDYVEPSYVLAGKQAAALTNKDKEPTESPGAGNKWTWNSTDKKWEATPISTVATAGSENDTRESGGAAAGGLMAMAGGGITGNGQLNLNIPLDIGGGGGGYTPAGGGFDFGGGLGKGVSNFKGQNNTAGNGFGTLASSLGMSQGLTSTPTANTLNQGNGLGAVGSGNSAAYEAEILRAKQMGFNFDRAPDVMGGNYMGGKGTGASFADNARQMGFFANGGMTGYAAGGQFNLGGYSDGGRLLRGPGDGVSDSIPATIGNKRPARLADGEFVVPARIVSELGNGSTEAGARKLYAMMDRVQKARRGTVGKGRVAKNSRSDKYLPA
jgi:hypothetical protein